MALAVVTSPQHDKENAMYRYTQHAARLLLGFTFVVFSLNYFALTPFIPPPVLTPEKAAFLGSLRAGWYLPVIKVLELTCGVVLLGNQFVPLALVVLAPINIAILIFHLVFDGIFGFGRDQVGPMVLIALHGYLAWAYRDAYKPLLRAVHVNDVEPPIPDILRRRDLTSPTRTRG